MNAVLGKMVLGFCLFAWLLVGIPIASAAGGWVEIRTDDETLLVTPGNWRITQWNPSSSTVINVDTPIQKNGRTIGYAAEMREPWRFMLQQYVPSGWRNPGITDYRMMAYFIPVDGSTHAVILTHVMFGGNDGKTIVGVMGTCRSPRDGSVHTIAFER